jgi:DMSO reductase family type II enzyme chaperone
VDTCAGTEAGSGAWDRVDLYRLFAFVFGAPSAERFAWLQRPELAAWLAELWDELGCAGAFPGVTASFTDYEDYESTYVGLFEVGLPAPPVPLQESAHDDSIPAPQTVLEDISFYDVLGLRVDPAHYAADHLVPQLEFLSAVRYARRSMPDADNRAQLAHLERDFLERHLLNWLPAAHKKLAGEESPLFPTLMTLLLAFVQSRMVR